MSDEKHLELVLEQEARINEARIEKIRSEIVNPLLKPIGRCHDCDEPFDKDDPLIDKKLFCNQECAASWQDYFNAQRRKHGPNYRPPVASGF